MNVLFIIPARGGSKGIPRKNIRSLAGSPLISYSIKNALSVNYDSDVYVSSEDDEILNIAHKYGAKQHKREEGLAGDEITLDSVIFDAYQAAKANEKKEYDLIITLQPTSPLLKVSTIEEAIAKMVNNSAIETVISAKEDTHLSWREENGKFLIEEVPLGWIKGRCPTKIRRTCLKCNKFIGYVNRYRKPKILCKSCKLLVSDKEMMEAFRKKY